MGNENQHKQNVTNKQFCFLGINLPSTVASSDSEFGEGTMRKTCDINSFHI